MKVLLAVIILPNVLNLVLSEQENPIVTTSLGKIVGSLLTTRLQKKIYAFRGIRYAQPPIGNLRFRPPLPVEPWPHIYNATVDGPICPQPGEPLASEDCLVLNVYSTKLPDDASPGPKRPVIVYVHAGGFYSVSGHSKWAGPQYLLDQEVVLVTINYRLGSLGFLSTGDAQAPGNNGLKDQVAAFRWIRNHIAAFGGDPDLVTLFGYSAGAISISLHLVSPMSRGLFHRAIVSSGSAVGQFRLPAHQVALAQKQARLVGCGEDGGTGSMLACLRNVSAKELGDSLLGFYEFLRDPILIWFPVIEEDYGQERFLCEDPVQTIKRGDFARVPIVTGITKDEFGAQAFPLVENRKVLDLFSDNFETYAPISFIYERDSRKSREVSASLRKFYLGEGPLTYQSFSGLAKLYGDSVTGFPVNRLVGLISEQSSRVFYYEFTYQGRFSHAYVPCSNNTVPYGVVHHDDLIYLFYIQPLFPFFDGTYPEGGMVETLTSLWADFARYGKPNSRRSHKFRSLVWEPYNDVTKRYLEIGERLTSRERLYQDRYDFWDKLFPVIV